MHLCSVYLYFFLFGFIAALLGVWAMMQADTTSIPAALKRTDWPSPPDPTKLQQCGDMNTFHKLLMLLYALMLAIFCFSRFACAL